MSNELGARKARRKGFHNNQERSSSSESDEGDASAIMDMAMNEKREVLNKEFNLSKAPEAPVENLLQPGILSPSDASPALTPSGPTQIQASAIPGAYRVSGISSRDDVSVISNPIVTKAQL